MPRYRWCERDSIPACVGSLPPIRRSATEDGIQHSSRHFWRRRYNMPFRSSWRVEVDTLLQYSLAPITQEWHRWTKTKRARPIQRHHPPDRIAHFDREGALPTRAILPTVNELHHVHLLHRPGNCQTAPGSAASLASVPVVRMASKEAVTVRPNGATRPSKAAG